MEFINAQATQKDKIMVIVACITMVEKPKQFIAFGRYGSGQIVAQKVEIEKMIRYLPVHKDEAYMILGNTDEEKRKSKQMRSALGLLEKVNFTSVKNIAYMAITAAGNLATGKCIIKHPIQWITHYGGPPMMALDRLTSPNPPIPKGDQTASKSSPAWKESETLRIKVDDLMKYSQNYDHWKMHISLLQEILSN
jgi:hypothetical protein